MRLPRSLALVVALVACKGGDKEPGLGHVGSGSAPPVAMGSGSAVGSGSAGSGGSGSAAGSDEEYVPAEHKLGMARWKDCGVYLDGKPVGFLSFGEMPITLKPTWVKDKVSAEMRAGTKDLPWRWAQQRFYKFTDYLKAIGIDLHKIKEMHVYASKFAETIIVNKNDLLSPAADGFMFRFGGDITGKAIPKVPPKFGNHRAPDKIASVMIYIDKTPPKLDEENEVFMLDGAPVMGVPYYGEPIRGGVRIYLDDKLVTMVKRQELDAKTARKAPDGELEWKLDDFLKAHGVDDSKVVEAYVIRDERRQEKLAKADLDAMWFSAGSQAHGGVLLGDKRIKANVLALHTRPLKPDELPVVLPEEEP